MKNFRDSMLKLVIETSCNLPADVRRAITAACPRETAGSQPAQAMEIVNQNIDMSCREQGAICQDTGMPTFEVHCPVGADQLQMEEDIRWAIAEATRLGKLRPNSVDSITDKNTGNNLSDTTPVVHFKQWRKGEVEVKMILKGGGSENMSAQYSLPAQLDHLGAAGRDLAGVRKCILHAIWNAQGKGCAPGFIGVGIGGDRGTSFAVAKHQLFRDLGDTNPVPELAALEQGILDEANTLNIGPMGFGGKITIMGCKIGAANRLPASFFVSVAYNCWAFRRLGVTIDPATGDIAALQHRDAKPADMAKEAGFPVTGREVRLRAPLTEAQVRSLHVGDVVLIDGPMVTGRDAMHKYLMKNDAPIDLTGQIIYHCGPVMLKDEAGTWHVKAAGPTTSIREEPYQGDVMKKFGLRAVVGKGGMGPKTLAALKEFGGVYLHAIGGAAQIYGKNLKKVKNVHLLEKFGVPEAMWELECDSFAAIVTMDSHGGSLHAEVLADSAAHLDELAAKK
jgi:fumarate hydratase class I